MKRAFYLLLALLVVIFLVWRFVRPLNIFVVDDRFAWPVDTTQAPPVLGALSAGDCAVCHAAFHEEWRTTIHSQACTDPYFQTDWQFDDSQHICRLCHTPLDRQQPHRILGYRDKDKWDPVMADNADFDPGLQHEGVTCAACHYREGKIVGVYGDTDSPHPVKKLEDPNQVCVRCHIVEGDRWDTFFRFPPCGTVAEIRSSPLSGLTQAEPKAVLLDRIVGNTGEVVMPDSVSLGCVQCHMPLLERPLVEGGKIRQTRQHLWRGGHDPAMVRQGLDIRFEEAEHQAGKQQFVLTITNVGAAHYIPTGTPDRYLSVDLRVLDHDGRVLKEEEHTIKRTVMWRPFIVDLRDTRLPRWQPRSYTLSVPEGEQQKAATVEAVVRYHLLNERRRKRIGYQNNEPIEYEVFHERLSLDAG